MQKKVSVIIPTYNEEKTIKDMFLELDKLNGNFEVLFVDGGSIDNTIDICRKEIELKKNKNYKIIVSNKGRAVQMNTAAKISTGEILWFLHCDSKIDKNSIMYIENAIDKNSVGCFSIYFESSKHIMKICGFMSRLRMKIRNIAFGDQGIFITKNLFDEIGGYEEIPIMEDYQLSMTLKKRGIKIIQLNSKIITSDRRYLQGGYLMTMYKMQKNQQMYRLNKDRYLNSIIYDDER